MKKTHLKYAVVLLFIGLLACFFYFDLGQYLHFEYLKQRQAELQSYQISKPFLFVAIYMIVYVLVTALSLPGAAILTLFAGALFGLVQGTIIVSFASTIGATAAFLVSRFMLRDIIQSKFGDKLKIINEGIEREGAFYLFTMRLIPAIPFFVINLVMGLTPIRTIQFFFVSQVGMLLGTIVYVNAGTELSKIQSISGILSPKLILSFALLGLFPLLTKKSIEWVKGRVHMTKSYSKVPRVRPKKFDYNLLVIGAGSGGLVSSYIAATLKARVGLIERHKMGGDCLNTGCVPSKALIRSAKMMAYAKRAKDFGFKSATIEYDFADVMMRVQSVVKKVEPHDSVERYTKLGVDCIQGDANIISPYEVQVNGKVLTTRAIIVATGASPFVPPIPGLDQIKYLTSDNVWELRHRPQRLLVLGGGPIGAELAQSFQRLGSQVTLIDRAPRIMAREDYDVSDLVMKKFQSEGMKVLVNHSAKSFSSVGGVKTLIADCNQVERKIAFNEVIVALGRQANVKGFGLEKLGVEITESGTIKANAFLATNYKNIFVCGDVAGPYQFTHTAAHQAYYASINALFTPFTRFIPSPFNKSLKVDYSVIPWATYTDPEVATVGLTERVAMEKGVKFEVTRYGIDDLDRAIADSEDSGFVKVLTKPGTDQILGATIVGYHASDLIGEFIAAMKNGFGLNSILGTIHIYPTMAEANKYLAGEWKKARKPERVLQMLEKFFSWRR